MSREDRVFWMFLGVYFIVKLVYLYLLKLPLSFDEAYYWDWSRIPAFGYYSKPPMVAWLIGLSTKIFGTSEFAVRLPALLCCILTLIFGYKLFKELLPKNKALSSTIFLGLVPIITIYSFVMTIDPPLIAFWTIALWCFVRYTKTLSTGYAVLCGIFAGLGLLTKQTMAAFLFFTLIYALLFLKNKRHFYLYLFSLVILPALIYLPNILWNLKHGFLMLKHTESHFTRKEHSILQFLNYFFGCNGAYTLIFTGLLVTGFSYLRSYKRSQVFDYLYVVSLPFLVFITLVALFIKININWIFPFVITGYFLWFWMEDFSGWRRFVSKVSWGIAIVFSFLLCTLAFKPGLFPPIMQKLLSKFQGWRTLAKEVTPVIPRDLPLVAENRHIAAELDFYLPWHPKAYVLNLSGHPESQYDVWRSVKKLNGKLVILVKSGLSPIGVLKEARLLKKVTVRRSYGNIVFSVWQGKLRL